jgi:hypothetical protein
MGMAPALLEETSYDESGNVQGNSRTGIVEKCK